MKVSSRLLKRTAAAAAAIAALAVLAVPAQAQSFGFGIQVGPDGKPNVSIGVNTGPGVRPGRPLAEVCFYSRTRYRGDSFCVAPGSTIRDLDEWTDEIGSFENPSGLDVTLCTNTRLRGSCATYTTSARSIGSFDGNVASLRVR